MELHTHAVLLWYYIPLLLLFYDYEKDQKIELNLHFFFFFVVYKCAFFFIVMVKWDYYYFKKTDGAEFWKISAGVKNHQVSRTKKNK